MESGFPARKSAEPWACVPLSGLKSQSILPQMCLDVRADSQISDLRNSGHRTSPQGLKAWSLALGG